MFCISLVTSLAVDGLLVTATDLNKVRTVKTQPNTIKVNYGCDRFLFNSGLGNIWFVSAQSNWLMQPKRNWRCWRHKILPVSKTHIRPKTTWACDAVTYWSPMFKSTTIICSDRRSKLCLQNLKRSDRGEGGRKYLCCDKRNYWYRTCCTGRIAADHAAYTCNGCRRPMWLKCDGVFMEICINQVYTKIQQWCFFICMPDSSVLRVFKTSKAWFRFG